MFECILVITFSEFDLFGNPWAHLCLVYVLDDGVYNKA